MLYSTTTTLLLLTFSFPIQAADWSHCQNLDDANQWSQRLLTAASNKSTDLGSPRETLEAICAEDMKVYSDSNWAAQRSVISSPDPIAPTRARFINGAIHDGTFEIYNTVIGCDYKIVHHFPSYFDDENKKFPVKTFAQWSLRKNSDVKGKSKLLAYRVDQEFNSVAWGLVAEGWEIRLRNGTVWKVG